MPYRIRRATGRRPFQIISIATGKVVGTSTDREMAKRSIDHRMSAESKDITKYKRKVDNKMAYHGETDLEKHTVRINKSKKKNKRPGEIGDTILHEKLHVLHPKAHEKTIRKNTVKKWKIMGKKQKAKLYNLFK